MANLDHYNHWKDRRRMFERPERAPKVQKEDSFEFPPDFFEMPRNMMQMLMEREMNQEINNGLYPGNRFRNDVPGHASDFIETRSEGFLMGESVYLIERDYSGKCHHCGNPDVVQGFQLKPKQVGHRAYMSKIIGFCQNHYQDVRGVDFSDPAWDVEKEIC